MKLGILKSSNFTWICIVLLSLISTSVLALPPKNFTEAKKVARVIFAEHRETLYCGCSYDKHSTINQKSCGLTGVHHPKRATRMEFEHMMPMDQVTRQFPCGRNYACVNKKGKRYRGRACCRKINASYRAIEGELYNLWPAVGSVNRARSNYRFTEFNAFQKAKLQPFDNCKIYIDAEGRKVEPRDEAKGIVARANLFMETHHKIRLSENQRKLFTAWDQRFPPDSWEKKWAQKVAAEMGYENKFITDWNKRY